jgi:hypothetical protein
MDYYFSEMALTFFLRRWGKLDVKHIVFMDGGFCCLISYNITSSFSSELDAVQQRQIFGSGFGRPIPCCRIRDRSGWRIVMCVRFGPASRAFIMCPMFAAPSPGMLDIRPAAVRMDDMRIAATTDDDKVALGRDDLAGFVLDGDRFEGKVTELITMEPRPWTLLVSGKMISRSVAIMNSL